MAKLTAKNLVRFSITVAEANAYHIHIEDLAGITEIIPNKKYLKIIYFFSKFNFLKKF